MGAPFWGVKKDPFWGAQEARRDRGVEEGGPDPDLTSGEVS